MSPTRSLLFLALTIFAVGMFQKVSANPTAAELRMTMFPSHDDTNAPVDEEVTNDNFTSYEYFNLTFASGENIRNETFANGENENSSNETLENYENQVNDDGHTITKRRAIKSNGVGNGKVYYSGIYPKVTGGGKLAGRGHGRGKGKGNIYIDDDSREAGVIYVAKISTDKSTVSTVAPDRDDDEIKEKGKRKPNKNDKARASSYEDTEEDEYKKPRRKNEEKTGKRREKVSRRTNVKDVSEEISEENEDNKRRVTYQPKSSQRKEKSSKKTNRGDVSEELSEKKEYKKPSSNYESKSGNKKERASQRTYQRDDFEDSSEDRY